MFILCDKRNIRDLYYVNNPKIFITYIKNPQLLFLIIVRLFFNELTILKIFFSSSNQYNMSSFGCIEVNDCRHVKPSLHLTESKRCEQ